MSEEAKLLQGNLYHRERGQQYIYVLDQEIGAIYCFKRKVNQIRSKVIILSKSEFPSYPSKFYLDSTLICENFYPSFDFVSEGQTFAVLISEDQDLSSIKRQFIDCSSLPVPLSYRKCCRAFRGLGFVLSIPFKISNMLCEGLESMGDKLNQAPERMFKVPIEDSKRYVPGNIASGILMGTGKMLYGIVTGIGGLVYEPLKGAKENGFKGATKGFGKGILGLVCKPVAGTIDLVTLTVRGVNNMPKSMYKSALKIYKKNKAKREKAHFSVSLEKLEDRAPDSHEILFESAYNSEKMIDNGKDYENVQGEIEIVETVEIIGPLLERNHKLREWILEISNYLNKEEELLYEDLSEDDIFELRVQEAKQIGKKLKKKVMALVEEFHNLHKEIGVSSETYLDYNSRMVANLKQLGLTIKDEFVLEVATIIEEELLGEDEEVLPVVKEVVKEKEIVKKNNPFIETAKSWKPYPHKDNYRIPEAGPKGGIPLSDPAIQSQLRAVGKEIIKTVGKKVLSGDFNLTTISFPIKCMMPNTSLHNTIKSVTLGPIFFTKAALTNNPIERLKFVTIATLGTYRTTSTFLKPVIPKQLNPIIGETLSAELEDGTKLYCEQTCNHPPISHFHIIGPDNLYMIRGYTQYQTSAGFNSLTIKNLGKKLLCFNDGSQIGFTFPDEQFTNTFIMTMRHETVGELEISDSKNNLKCLIKLGANSKEPSDYLEGVIIEENKRIVSKLKGTYLGYLEFDGIRYWDAREAHSFPLIIKKDLPSDSDFREDLILLQEGKIELAQAAKERMEQAQRYDRKLREEYRKKK